MTYVPFTHRHGSIPPLETLEVKVADITDAELFPNIAEALEWARKSRSIDDVE